MNIPSQAQNLNLSNPTSPPNLFPVQLAALKQADQRSKFGYFLEMGLGKTLVVLDEFYDLSVAGQADVLLVICPNSLIPVWKTEIVKHGYHFNVFVKPSSLRHVKSPCVVLYNYESIIATPGKLIPDIIKSFATYCVFDESVCMKGFKSKRWKAVQIWQEKCKYIRLLSGRPLVQSAMDLWTQLTLLNAAVSPSPYAFRNRYCIMGGWMGKQIIGTMNKEQLQNIVKSVSYTAFKKDWTDLPEKLYTERHYDLTPEQKMLYRQMFNDMIVNIKSTTISVQQAVHKFSKLQQIGSGFIIDEEGKATPIMPFDELPKVKVLDEILEQTNGKIIIFAHYRASVAALHKKYQGVLIEGGMNESQIANAINTFNDGPNQVLAAQVSAAKYGLTLLGNKEKPCHTTVYFENNYSLDSRIQSEDRNHRHGQRNPVLYIDFIGSPVDRRIITALQRKNDLGKTIMGMVEEEI